MALLLAPLMVSSPVFAADSLEVTVTNRTDANIWIAFGMAAEDEGNFSKGWWGIAPGQTRVIKPFRYTPVYGYYYFAFNPKMNRYWHGKNKPNWHPFLDQQGQELQRPSWTASARRCQLRLCVA